MEESKEYLDQVNSGVVRTNDDELQLIEDQLHYVADSIAFYEAELDAHKRLLAIYERGIRRLKPEYNYQESEDYWIVQRDLNVINKKREINTLEVELKKANEAQDKLTKKHALLKGE